MGRLCFIVANTGMGKSYSMRNLPPEKCIIINTDKKELPWRQYGKQWNKELKNYLETSDIEDIRAIIKYGAENDKKIIVIDTWNMNVNDLVFSEEFRKQGKDYMTKWGEMAASQYQLFNYIRDNTPDDMYVYLMAHPEETLNEDTGLIEMRIAVHGGMLRKVRPESKSTIVLYADVQKKAEGVQYKFRTQTTGRDTCKTPVGMFEDSLVDNDLLEVDATIRDYYGLNSIKDGKARTKNAGS